MERNIYHRGKQRYSRDPLKYKNPYYDKLMKKQTSRRQFYVNQGYQDKMRINQKMFVMISVYTPNKYAMCISIKNAFVYQKYLQQLFGIQIL